MVHFTVYVTVNECRSFNSTSANGNDRFLRIPPTAAYQITLLEYFKYYTLIYFIL